MIIVVLLIAVDVANLMDHYPLMHCAAALRLIVSLPSCPDSTLPRLLIAAIDFFKDNDQDQSIDRCCCSLYV